MIFPVPGCVQSVDCRLDIVEEVQKQQGEEIETLLENPQRRSIWAAAHLLWHVHWQAAEAERLREKSSILRTMLFLRAQECKILELACTNADHPLRLALGTWLAIPVEQRPQNLESLLQEYFNDPSLSRSAAATEASMFYSFPPPLLQNSSSDHLSLGRQPSLAASTSTAQVSSRKNREAAGLLNWMRWPGDLWAALQGPPDTHDRIQRLLTRQQLHNEQLNQLSLLPWWLIRIGSDYARQTDFEALLKGFEQDAKDIADFHQELEQLKQLLKKISALSQLLLKRVVQERCETRVE